MKNSLQTDPGTVLGQFVAVLLPPRPWFDPVPVHVSVVVDKATLWQVFFAYFGVPCQYYSTSIPYWFSSMLLLPDGQRGKVLGTFKKQCSCGNVKYFCFILASGKLISSNTLNLQPVCKHSLVFCTQQYMLPYSNDVNASDCWWLSFSD
jgi:hypothetical protein